jgi:hypothetical protein
VPKHDETDDMFIIDSIPEPVIAGRHPDTPRAPNRPTGGMTTVRETRPNRACAPYADSLSSGPVTPVREPERRSTTTRPPTRPSSAVPRGGAARFPVSGPRLDEVLNGRSVMEHLSAFQITQSYRGRAELGGRYGSASGDVPEDADEPSPVRGTGRRTAPVN